MRATAFFKSLNISYFFHSQQNLLVNLLFLKRHHTNIIQHPGLSLLIHTLVSGFSSVISPRPAQSGLNEGEFSVSGAKLHPPVLVSLPHSRLHISAGREEVSRAETL